MLTSYDCIFMLLEVIYTLTVYKIINVFLLIKKSILFMKKFYILSLILL